MKKIKGERYLVGYGRPPIETRYKPGQSGNPNGRPKARPSIEERFAKEFEKTILVQTENGPKRVKKSDLIVQQFTTLALKGDRKLLVASLNILEAVEARAARMAKNVEPRFTKEQLKAMSTSERTELYMKLIQESRNPSKD